MDLHQYRAEERIILDYGTFDVVGMGSLKLHGIVVTTRSQQSYVQSVSCLRKLSLDFVQFIGFSPRRKKAVGEAKSGCQDETERAWEGVGTAKEEMIALEGSL